jgi:hypothetical protein
MQFPQPFLSFAVTTTGKEHEVEFQRLIIQLLSLLDLDHDKPGNSVVRMKLTQQSM